MSVWVFKDNEKELIPAEFLESQLEAGWSVTDPATVVPDEPEDEVVSEAPTTDPLSNEQIREKAKEAGIEDYDKLRINTLKEKLEAS